MENADPVLVRRMIDFIGGICYAIGELCRKLVIR
jgi:FtsZ-interacting cell division protein YlmF